MVRHQRKQQVKVQMKKKMISQEVQGINGRFECNSCKKSFSQDFFRSFPSIVFQDIFDRISLKSSRFDRFFRLRSFIRDKLSRIAWSCPG